MRQGMVVFDGGAGIPLFKGGQHFSVITGDDVLLQVPSFMHDMKIASGLCCS